ncbi:hypothetical protein [Sporosarcina sp. A2]|uniref:hypothetical protein n=1 Tax=Sporosarcina sp. A2 TaxID=3393449 RepID=UPI003D7ADA87
MKKFLVFISSFVIIFMAFQIVSGLILTSSFTPNPSSVANDLSREVSFGNASNPLLLTLLTATLVYFISQKKFRISKAPTNKRVRLLYKRYRLYHNRAI